MLGKLLKSLRKSNGPIYTLDYIQEKSGVPKGHLSRIENGKVMPTEEMLMKILMHGFNLRPSEAKDLIAKWRIEDALDRASDPDKVIQEVAGDNNIVISGSGNTVQK